MEPLITVKKLFELLKSKQLITNQIVKLQGWVRTNRNNGSIGFIEFNDGTNFTNFQLVYDKDQVSDFPFLAGLHTGSAIEVIGRVILTPEMKQPFELHIQQLILHGDSDEDYPLQKKRHSFEYLREIAHLRTRSNTFMAIFKVRSVLSAIIHEFFQKNDFVYIHTPIITGNDAEGAGQSFKVIADEKKPDEFFHHSASLTVSGQLHVEPFALTYGKVYTFGPTFRAEQSNTARHAAEFWMIEPEIAFCDLSGNMDVIEACVKYCIQEIYARCPQEMDFFNKFIDTTLKERLDLVLNAPFKRMSYTEGIDLLLKAQKEGYKFVYNDIKWGMDLQSEHERYLTEQIVKGPLFLINYPKDIKAFYMKVNDDNQTVAACDLLVPQVGELVGGSQREERYDVLFAKMQEQGNVKGLEWYLDTRRFGGCVHSGFGIGFERLLMYISGISNIRDVQPYPRNFGSLKY